MPRRSFPHLKEIEFNMKEGQSAHSKARSAWCSESPDSPDNQEQEPSAFSALNQRQLGESKHPISAPLQR